MKENLSTETEKSLGPLPLPLDDRRPFLEHLEELRWRFLRSFLWVTMGSVIAFRFSHRILSWLIHPIGRVVFLSPAEPLLVHLKVALLSGLALSLPLLAWEAWGFLSPAVSVKERRPALFVVPMSVGLFLLGAWFGWKILVPLSLKVLLSFSSELFTPMITLGSYISFVGWLVVACGLFFQMPMVMMFLTRIGWVSPRAFLRQWRVAVVSILVLAAVLTPTPDVATQLLLALPMIALYLISVGLAFLVAR